MIRVAVVGTGYWGPNLIRNFAACPTARLVAACDANSQRLNQVLSSFPTADAVVELDELLARDDVDAVALATPVHTHAPLGQKILNAGKHLLVEKPLASSVADARQLVDLAAEKELVLMVDHTFIYSPAVRKIKQLLESGEIGDIYYVDSVRINLGLFQHDVNVVWDLAPHDLSILEFLLERSPRSVTAVGASHADRRGEIEDMAYLNLDYGDGLLSSIHVNWLSPVKVRHLIVGGSRKSVVFDDLAAAEKVKVYDRGITVGDDAHNRLNVMVGYRTGDVLIPHLEPTEPLQTMVRHFVECIEKQLTPQSDGQRGLRVVQALEAANASIKTGQRVELPGIDID